jgi:hypothetical protein
MIIKPSVGFPCCIIISINQTISVIKSLIKYSIKSIATQSFFINYINPMKWTLNISWIDHQDKVLFELSYSIQKLILFLKLKLASYLRILQFHKVYYQVLNEITKLFRMHFKFNLLKSEIKRKKKLKIKTKKFLIN